MGRTIEFLLVCVLLTPCRAQVVIGGSGATVGSGGGGGAGVIRVDVDLVNVLCSVRDRAGAWAQGLTREDFEVREDGKVRAVSHFAAETDSPLTVALMVDVSGSVTSILEIERAAARRFLDEVIRPGDQALVGGFSSTIPIWQDLTGSKDELRSALARVGETGALTGDGGVRARGGTLLYDAVELVTRRKLVPLSGRKTLVLITDGMDNGSQVKIEAAVQSAQRADAVVFAIHYVPESRDTAEGRRALSRLAEPTGGRVFDVSSKMPLERVFAEIADEMRHQYSLGFTPAVRDREFHKLEVRVKKPGMKPQARNGYFGMPR